MKILIGGAWPYANGSLHIGHIASLLPGDVIARYYRSKGDEVYYVSGSDCHGTPIVVRAMEEKKSPEEISDFYHSEFCRCFEKMGFSYDRYGKTSSDWHKEFVKEFHKQMYKSKYIREEEPEAFCNNCKTHLSDRFISGECPICGGKALGDQCTVCQAVLEAKNLVNPVCTICGSPAEFSMGRQLVIKLSEMEPQLTDYIESHKHWRKNAIAFSNRYIKEGLRDRAITRNLSWGIDVPRSGYGDKKIYIWAENVLGYLSMSRTVCRQRGADYNSLWSEGSRHYYVHGKDNIPFHTIILPALLLAHGGYHLPDIIVSSEYLTLEGRKISTSENHAIWIKDIMEEYSPDSLRYFFIANGPEKRDSDFTTEEFIKSNNGELLGAYGNFINRTLAFIYKYFDGVIPCSQVDDEIIESIESLYKSAGELIEAACLKDCLDRIFDFIRRSNKYFDTEKPWLTRNSDLSACNHTLYNCVQIIANLAVLLEPFLPFSSEIVRGWLGLGNEWRLHLVDGAAKIPCPKPLFERY